MSESGDGRGVRALFLALLLLLLVAGCPESPPPAPPTPPAPRGPSTPPPAPREDGRLPPLATPLTYTLTFDVDPAKPTFGGSVRIDVSLPETTSYVVLNGRALTFTDVHAVLDGSSRPIAAQVSSRAAFRAKSETDEIVLAFDEPLPRGKAALFFAYTALFSGDLAGLYRTQDEARWYAFTQFEATDARRAFPCFDEPGFKTSYDLSVTVPTGMIAVANNPEVEHLTTGPKTTFRFSRTPPLPSYLVAFAVGELELHELPRRGNAKPAIRLVTTKGKQASFGVTSLETTQAVLEALETWFGIPFPFEKLDLVAVPDFGPGAMENPGLVTAREDILLVDPAHASTRARRRQTEIIAHELAHEWFGDLVTASWWDDLWLNEGFANWMEERITAQLQPSWGTKNDAVAHVLDVMDSDALASARSVRQHVVTTSDADEAFDDITYEKGAAVLGTIERWIGEQAFQKGVREYLAANAWHSVTADRLFSALDRASGKNVSQMAGTFVDQPGVPDVTARLECDPGSRWHIELSGEAYRPIGSPLPEDLARTWSVPVCVTAQGEKTPTCAELTQGAPAIIAGRKCPAWVHPNTDSRYYRFSMPDADLVKVANARASLDIPQRLTLLSNTAGGMRAGKNKPATLFKVFAAFDDDDARQITESIVDTLVWLDIVLIDDAARPAFRKYVQARLAKKKSKLGWLAKKDAADTDEQTLLRRDVLGALGDLGDDETTLREAEPYAARWIADQDSLDPDLAALAVSLANRHAGKARLDQLIGIAKGSKRHADRLVALRSLAAFDDPALLRTAFDLLLTDDVKAQDVMSVVGAAYSRRRARTIMEAWIRAHFDALRAKLPGTLGNGLVGGVAIACTKTELADATAFYAPRAAGVEGSSRIFAEATEGASLCAEMRRTLAPHLTRDILNGKISVK